MATIDSFIKPVTLLLKRRETSGFLVILISGLGLIGWMTGKIRLAAYSSDFYPISHISALIFIGLGIYIILQRNNSIKSIRFKSAIFLSLVTLLCLYLFFNYFFRFTKDVESIFIRNTSDLIGHSSPISFSLFILLCFSLLGQISGKKKFWTYLGCYSSIVVLLVSSIILIGYLYKAPLLYGSRIVPVSLPSAINFFLMSITVIRYYDFHIWMFNSQLWDNTITRQLIKSFLPIIIPLILIDGFLDARVHIYNVNPTLKSAIILIIVITIIIFMIIRISAVVGNELHINEKKLKESEMKLRTVADYNYDWEFWLSDDGHFIFNSPSCERITGYRQKDFFSDPDLMTKIIHPEDLAVYRNHINARNQAKPCGGIDYRIVTRTGEIRWISHVCQPVYDEDNSIAGRRGSNSDITERKNAENQVNELNKKLMLLNSDKDRFISILGHDLRSPLNNILGLTDIFKQELSELTAEEIKKFAEDLNKSALLTNSLLEDILMWARSQQGTIPFKPQMQSLATVCQNIISILNPNAFAKNITIYQLVDERIKVYADQSMLKTIMLNLVSNAIKFTNPGGRISIYAHESEDNITVTVSDTGVGISPENIVKLFDISQVISTKGTAEETGTGLGLLLCRDFIEKHGGRIRVVSKTGKGSDFIFTLPKLMV